MSLAMLFLLNIFHIFIMLFPLYMPLHPICPFFLIHQNLVRLINFHRGLFNEEQRLGLPSSFQVFHSRWTSMDFYLHLSFLTSNPLPFLVLTNKQFFMTQNYLRIILGAWFHVHPGHSNWLQIGLDN